MFETSSSDQERQEIDLSLKSEYLAPSKYLFETHNLASINEGPTESSIHDFLPVIIDTVAAEYKGNHLPKHFRAEWVIRKPRLEHISNIFDDSKIRVILTIFVENQKLHATSICIEGIGGNGAFNLNSSSLFMDSLDAFLEASAIRFSRIIFHDPTTNKWFPRA